MSKESHRAMIGALACMPIVIGCTSRQSMLQDVETAIEGWRRSSVSIGENGVDEAPTEPDRQPEEQSLNLGATSVSGFLQEALVRNPSLRASMAQARAKLARVDQVTSLPLVMRISRSA